MELVSWKRQYSVQVKGVLQKLKAGRELSPLDHIAFIRHWLIDHILVKDRKAGVILRENPARVRPTPKISI